MRLPRFLSSLFASGAPSDWLVLVAGCAVVFAYAVVGPM